LDEWLQVNKLIFATAKEKNFLPPFEVRITCGDDELVCHLLVEPPDDERPRKCASKKRALSGIRRRGIRSRPLLDDINKTFEITITCTMVQ